MTPAPQYVGAIDQGTTSTRFALVDHSGRIVAMAQREHRQILPRPGWVEHDPEEIWANTEKVIAEAIEEAGVKPSHLAAVGITNQRETTLAWRSDGVPLTPAVVWQDTRTAQLCRDLGGDDGQDRFRETTGLPLATYFSGPKMRWLLDATPGLEDSARAGNVRFGTIDSWLAWKLTGRHVTDVTNASRTMLMDLGSVSWSDDLLEAFGIPSSALPEIVPSVGELGRAGGVLEGVPVAGILGDQQAGLFGQGCFVAGEAKTTYGTGCFMLLNTGTERVPSEHGLLTTVAYQAGDDPVRYALEGSVAIAGAAVQWLRDELGLIESAGDVEALARTVDDNGGVYFVPAFSGLFAPHWRSDARGVIAGLTRFSKAGHIARATLEAVAYQARDVLEAMEADSGLELSVLKVDGGMVANELLMQFQADLLSSPVVLPAVTETTVLGAAYAAGLAVGFWEDVEDVAGRWREARRFEPDMEDSNRSELLAGWHKALDRSLDWVDEE
jgi:glycerol kinase